MNTRESFQPGTLVIYGLHGKCEIIGIETRQNSGESISYYKLEVQKSPLSRSTRQEPAIWVPVSSAQERGLRAPMTASENESVFKLISNREYYYPLNEAWPAIKPKLESSIRSEGILGLAKALSYLHVLKKKQIVATPDISRLYDAISKLLIRELHEATSVPAREIESRIAKGLRQKIIPNN